MTEPISVRTEAINTLRTLLGQSTGSGDTELDTLSGEISSANATTSTLANSVVSLKNSVALLKAQMEVIATKVNADISSVEIKESDAASDEELAGTSNIVYSVEKGTIDIDNFYSDETHWIKHYTYDTLHIITYCLKTAKKLATADSQIWKVASFTDLSSVPDSGACMGECSYSGAVFMIENNNVYIKLTAATYLAAGEVYSGNFFWFDRNLSSKMFTYDDGYLVSANVAASSPFFATHASVGNLHFLSIHTKTVKQFTSNTEYKLAEFSVNLPITNASNMGTVAGHNGTYARVGRVIAPDTKTISFIWDHTQSKTMEVNTFLAINSIWIDSNATANDFAIYNGSTSVASSSNKICKYLTYKHFNVIQVSGNAASSWSSSTTTLATFTEPINTPDAEYLGQLYPIGTTSKRVLVSKQDARSLAYTVKYNSAQTGYFTYTYIWFA